MSDSGALLGASFRDPEGQVFSFNQRILRFVSSDGLSSFDAFKGSKAYQQFSESGRLVQTRQLEDSVLANLASDDCLEPMLSPQNRTAVLEHERIVFPSFPYEWPPEMLHAAGELTIQFQLALVEEGFGLKDATPYNVLFRGPKPVFV